MKNISVYLRSFFNQVQIKALCPLCCQPTAGRICQGCLDDLPWLTSGCRHCAEPLPASTLTLTCGRCLKSPLALEKAWVPLLYRFPVNHLVRAIKDGGDVELLYLAAELFVRQFGDAIREDPPELLVPVPLHPRRRRQRGYNQSEEWARLLGARLGIAVAPQACSRLLDTPHQQGLSAKARRRNLKKAFAVKPSFRSHHIALVDDVLTTGTTLDLLARQFSARQVGRIDAWCLARTPSPGD